MYQKSLSPLKYWTMSNIEWLKLSVWNIFHLIPINEIAIFCYRDAGRKDPRELQTTTMDLFSKCQKERMDNLDQANQELDRLRKHADKIQTELQGLYNLTQS